MPVAAILSTLLALAVSAAPAVAAPARPFGSHPVALAGGTLQPRVAPGERDRATAAAYDAWAARYLEPGCEPGHLLVRSAPDTEAHVVSEGQGYGMVIVALMAGHDARAQERFDGLARYALAHPSAVDGRLVAGAQDAACRDVDGGDSATDGDFDVAYGLLLAHAQWGSEGALDYLAAARRLLAGALAEDIHPEGDLTTLGRRTSTPGFEGAGPAAVAGRFVTLTIRVMFNVTIAREAAASAEAPADPGPSSMPVLTFA